MGQREDLKAWRKTQQERLRARRREENDLRAEIGAVGAELFDEHQFANTVVHASRSFGGVDIVDGPFGTSSGGSTLGGLSFDPSWIPPCPQCHSSDREEMAADDPDMEKFKVAEAQLGPGRAVRCRSCGVMIGVSNTWAELPRLGLSNGPATSATSGTWWQSAPEQLTRRQRCNLCPAVAAPPSKPPTNGLEGPGPALRVLVSCAPLRHPWLPRFVRREPRGATRRAE